jgi:hypothetical protein
VAQPSRDGILRIPASTVHRVLVRSGLSRLVWMDRPTGRLVRRIHTSRPGELVHIDLKRLTRIPEGGGHRILGQVAGRPHQRDGTGYAHILSAIDAYSRLAYFRIRRSGERRDVRGVPRAGDKVRG